MPTYDYVCRSCQHEFELFQQISAAVKRKCPSCGALKLERQIGSGAAVIFRGSGFFQTDYRTDAYKKAAEAEKKEKTEGAKKGKGESSTKKPKADS